MHRVDAYKATEVMRADDQEETVFSGQWYKSNGKHSGQSEGNANHVGTSVNRCSFPVPDPCGLYHQVPPISARNVPKLLEMSHFEPRKKSKKRIALQ